MGLADRDYVRNRSWKYRSGKSQPPRPSASPGNKRQAPKQRASSDRWLKSRKLVRDGDILAGYERDRRERGPARKRRWRGILRFAVAVIAFGVASGIAFSIVREMV